MNVFKNRNDLFEVHKITLDIILFKYKRILNRKILLSILDRIYGTIHVQYAKKMQYFSTFL